MARITVEDCLENVANRFELVMLAAKRARQLATTGAEPYVDWENDKPTVVALREIAEGHTIFDEPVEEEREILPAEKPSLFTTTSSATLFDVHGSRHLDDDL